MPSTPEVVLPEAAALRSPRSPLAQCGHRRQRHHHHLERREAEQVRMNARATTAPPAPIVPAPAPIAESDGQCLDGRRRESRIGSVRRVGRPRRRAPVPSASTAPEPVAIRGCSIAAGLLRVQEVVVDMDDHPHADRLQQWRAHRRGSRSRSRSRPGHGRHSQPPRGHLVETAAQLVQRYMLGTFRPSSNSLLRRRSRMRKSGSRRTRRHVGRRVARRSGGTGATSLATPSRPDSVNNQAVDADAHVHAHACHLGGIQPPAA